ncbi:polysaccharide deacetylase family protein [Mycolicibacterium nivoides]|uniref:Polysaccharide deacetylase family protein n=2 Tax=Actinomycetes TaxID=1760 RepID=A0ABW9LIB8_9MYCO
MNHSFDPLAGLRVAVTIDDQFQWTGIPFPTGHGPKSVSQAMIEAFANHNVPEVYAFNSTAPTDDDPNILKILDDWCAAGHHVGNHTHQHISLNWIDADTYLGDVDKSEKILSPWLEQAPSRYFRYAFAMEGDTLEKTRQVQTHLTRTGYLSSPVTLWFYDAQFAVAYQRALALADVDAQKWLEDTLVRTAVAQVREQAAAAAGALGRSPAHILLLHGTTIAGVTVDRILGELARLGVQFITSEEAMRDPANSIGSPLTTRQFRNSSQKWAEFAGVEVKDTPPAVLAEVEAVAVLEGQSWNEVLGNATAEWARRIPFTPSPADFH